MPALVLRDPKVTLATDCSYYVLRSHGRTFHRLAPAKIDLVILFDGVEATRTALDRLALTGVPVTFLHKDGSVKARLSPLWKADAGARLAQAAAHLDPASRLALACKIGSARFANAATALRRDFSRTPAIPPACDELERAAEACLCARTAESLTALLADAETTYYRAFATLLPEPFVFSGRTRRPPCDPVNALLSYAGAALCQHLHSYVEALALDPYVGFLHAQPSGRPNLCLDLLEPLLPVLVDRFTLLLLHRREFTPEHTEHPTPGHPATLLNADGRLAFITTFTRWSQDGDPWYVPHHYMSPEHLLLSEAERFETAARTGHLAEFEPFRLFH